MRGALELLTRVGAGEYANVPADGGIPASLQIEHRVSHAGYLVDVGLTGRFHGAENHIRRRAALGDIIPTDNGGDGVFSPAYLAQNQLSDRPIEPGIEGDFDPLLVQPGKGLTGARQRVDAVAHVPVCQAGTELGEDLLGLGRAPGCITRELALDEAANGLALGCAAHAADGFRGDLNAMYLQHAGERFSHLTGIRKGGARQIEDHEFDEIMHLFLRVLFTVGSEPLINQLVEGAIGLYIGEANIDPV